MTKAAEVIQHPNPGARPKRGPSAARAEFLALVEEARSLGYVRGVLIAEGVQGDFEVLLSPSVTNSTAIGLLQRGLARQTKRIVAEDDDPDEYDPAAG